MLAQGFEVSPRSATLTTAQNVGGMVFTGRLRREDGAAPAILTWKLKPDFGLAAVFDNQFRHAVA
jgi:hypothetical protein